MRILSLGALAGAAMLTIGVAQSQAAPLGFAKPAAAANGAIVHVQLVCDPSRCIDPRTGAYTQSGCNYRGCYPISGVVGYTNPRGGYGGGYERPYYHERRWGY